MYGDASFIAHLVWTFFGQLLLEHNTSSVKVGEGGSERKKTKQNTHMHRAHHRPFKKSLSENQNKAILPLSLSLPPSSTCCPQSIPSKTWRQMLLC